MLFNMADLSRISVVIVDDHPLFRQGLRQVIASDPRFDLVGEAENGEAALQLIEQARPQIAVLGDIDQAAGRQRSR